MKILSVAILSVTLILTGCLNKNAPKAPTITMYLYDAPSGEAMCSRTDGYKCPRLNLNQMDKYFMFSPTDWQNINDYIDALILSLKSPDNGPVIMSARGDTLRALQELKKTLDNMRFE